VISIQKNESSINTTVEIEEGNGKAGSNILAYAERTKKYVVN
jgi:hypothetical protein